jgi:tripartite-type tricarboxylate transporter receptor subunit TctC
MPAEIKQRIASDMRTIIADPAFRARVVGVGTAPRTGTPEEFAAAVEEQRAKIAIIHQATPKPAP